MLRTLLIFYLEFFKSKNRLRLENIYLSKQLEILNRTNKKFHIKNRDNTVYIEHFTQIFHLINNIFLTDLNFSVCIW